MSSSLVQIVYVTGFPPTDVKHGSNHRSYQIYYDLIDSIGENNVKVIDLNSNEVSQQLSKSTSIALCVIDHPFHGNIFYNNKKLGIPTIICPHNIKALDTQFVVETSVSWIEVLYTDFMRELRMLSGCQERLCISKVEAGMLGGLGIPSKYYAYYPVGVIRKRLERIRERRANEAREKGLLLLVGTAAHVTTKKAIEWFMKSAQEQGLPSGVRVVVAGLGTEEIEKEVGKAVGVEVAGWLEEETLEELLVKAVGVLAPQRTGFGALTRIAEMACAGIPLAVSRHASYAVDMPPGVRSVEDNWEAWWQAMEEMIHPNEQGKIEVYKDWFSRQTNPLKEVLNKYI